MKFLIHKLFFNDWIRRNAGDVFLEVSSHKEASFKRVGSSYVLTNLLVKPLLFFFDKCFLLPIKYRAASGAFLKLASGDFDGALANFSLAANWGFYRLDVILVRLAKIQLHCGRYEFSRNLLDLAFDLKPSNPEAAYNLGLLSLVTGDENSARSHILHAIALDHRYAMAHQNMAARYERDSWIPTDFDLSGDPDVHLYDAYHFIGQLLIHSADAEKGIAMFGAAMALQRSLEKKYEIPKHLLDVLCRVEGYDPQKPLRILPYEWVTQIGHIGMIDALLKMQRLGMRPDCNWVLLAPQGKIANADFLQRLKSYLVILHDPTLINALFPYQRICGEQFNCYVNEDGSAVDWSDAAAQAFIEWDRRGYGPLISFSGQAADVERKRLSELGLPKNAWFAVLHVRSGGFYGEGAGHIQKHRNAPLKSYLPAIRRIHEAGGWVIRIGDSSMPPLGELPMTIDLAHSSYSSRSMDVYLWSHARFFLGTTSGPTNAVIAFHTPCLLVNCVSNYAQSWNSQVMFVLKPFWSESARRHLTLREVFTPEFRAKMFNIRALVEEGIYPEANSSEDILAATEEMIEYLEGDGFPKMQDPGVLENSGCSMWLWGNAHPSKRFFEMHHRRLVA